MLMASLIGLQSLGITVDFPDEVTTGGDMEWVFAAPLEVKGGRYLKLILQAKRAQLAKLKKGKREAGKLRLGPSYVGGFNSCLFFIA